MAAFSFIQPPGTHRAGGGAYICALITALRAAGHEAEILTSPDRQPGRIVVIDGLALPALADANLEDAVGLIHHTTALANDDARDAVRVAEQAMLPRLRRVVATSDAVGARLREAFGVLPSRLTVLAPGVQDGPRSTGSDTTGCAILSVGALVPRKGHAVLLQALAPLFDLDWSLTIAGDDTRDPACAASLRAQAAADGIASRVEFAGEVGDLQPLWQRADMFASMTEWEGYPAAVNQALRQGMPVAVTTAVAMAVTPACGVVVPVGDAVQLSKAIRRIIFDPALRADMADAAWRIGQTLPGWPEQAARFVEAVA